MNFKPADHHNISNDSTPIVVSIVGRPNVGKSTLFNRIARKKLALVADYPGVTRDRREFIVNIFGVDFKFIDTAGLDGSETDVSSLSGKMREQTEIAINSSDICLFVYDARQGISAADSYFADLLRKYSGSVIVLANKCEGKATLSGLYDGYSLGLGEAIAISAEHGEGVSDLYDNLLKIAEEKKENNTRVSDSFIELEKEQLPIETNSVPNSDLNDEQNVSDDTPLRIAIVGRPNAGKSTLINKIIGEERLLTGEEAGVTRDSIAVDLQWDDIKLRLYDTAGMRKKSKVKNFLEQISVSDSLRAIKFAEIVILVVDAMQPLEKQDLQLADLVDREGRALILAVNKWDLIDNKADLLNDIERRIKTHFSQLKQLPVITLSAKTGSGITKIMPKVMEICEEWNSRIPTGELNRWLDEITQYHPPPLVQNSRIRIKYITQVKTRPPTFVAFCTKSKKLPDSYKRYLLNSLRESFDIPSVPIRLMLRSGHNPYSK